MASFRPNQVDTRPTLNASLMPARFRCPRRLGLATGILILGLILLRAVWGFAAHRRLNAQVEEYRSAGQLVSVDQFNAELDAVAVRGNAAAYQPAYVVPVYDVGDDNMNVPFVLNVAYNNAAIIAVQDWDSKSQNSPDFWVAYLLQSFQGQASDQDNDPNSEVSTLGATPVPAGGSVIFLEVHQIHEGVTNPIAEEQITVVHETGHAVGRSDDHPVTGNDDQDSTFVGNYLAHIRSSNRPYP